MEISSFLRLSPRRLLALVVVALIGAGLGLVAAMNAPTEYTVSASIRVGDIFAPAGNSFEINPYALGLVGVLREGPVQDQIAETAGVDASVVDTMEASQPEEGGPVVLSVTTEDVEDGEAVIRAAASVGLTEYTNRLVERATARTAKTQADLQAATETLLVWEGASGFGYGLSDQLNRIQLTVLPEARADVNNPELTTAVATARVAEIEATLEEARQLLPDLTPLEQQYDRSVARNAEASGAELAAQDAQAVVAANVDTYVVAGETVEVSRMPTLIRGAIGGAVVFAGLLLLAFFIRAVLLERKATRARTAPKPSAADKRSGGRKPAAASNGKKPSKRSKGSKVAAGGAGESETEATPAEDAGTDRDERTASTTSDADSPESESESASESTDEDEKVGAGVAARSGKSTARTRQASAGRSAAKTPKGSAKKAPAKTPTASGSAGRGSRGKSAGPGASDPAGSATSQKTAKGGTATAAREKSAGEKSPGEKSPGEKSPGETSAEAPEEKVTPAASTKTPPRRPSKTTTGRRTGRGAAGSRRATGRS